METLGPDHHAAARVAEEAALTEEAGLRPAVRVLDVRCVMCDQVGDLVFVNDAVPELTRWLDHVEAEHRPIVDCDVLRITPHRLYPPRGVDPAIWLTGYNARTRKDRTMNTD